jgi:hypothetical protein
MLGGVLGCVSVFGVPDSDQAQAGQPEGHGALDGAAQPVAGLADAEHLTGIGEGLLDAPPGRIACYHVFGGGEKVGGDEGKPVAAIIAVPGVGCVVADQNDPDGAGVE